MTAVHLKMPHQGTIQLQLLCGGLTLSPTYLTAYTVNPFINYHFQSIPSQFLLYYCFSVFYSSLLHYWMLRPNVVFEGLICLIVSDTFPISQVSWQPVAFVVRKKYQNLNARKQLPSPIPQASFDSSYTCKCGTDAAAMVSLWIYHSLWV